MGLSLLSSSLTILNPAEENCSPLARLLSLELLSKPSGLPATSSSSTRSCSHPLHCLLHLRPLRLLHLRCQPVRRSPRAKARANGRNDDGRGEERRHDDGREKDDEMMEEMGEMMDEMAAAE